MLQNYSDNQYTIGIPYLQVLHPQIQPTIVDYLKDRICGIEHEQTRLFLTIIP